MITATASLLDSRNQIDSELFEYIIAIANALVHVSKLSRSDVKDLICVMKMGLGTKTSEKLKALALSGLASAAEKFIELIPVICMDGVLEKVNELMLDHSKNLFVPAHKLLIMMTPSNDSNIVS